jgi:hypothetical protein
MIISFDQQEVTKNDISFVVLIVQLECLNFPCRHFKRDKCEKNDEMVRPAIARIKFAIY